MMLAKIWERLRGYDRWIPATARVKSSTLAGVDLDGVAKSGDTKTRPLAWESVCTVVWNDQHGVEQTAAFEAFEESPLYQLVDGDEIDLRFNPERPGEFYLPSLLHSHLARAWKMGVYGFLLILASGALLAAWFGPELLNSFAH